MAPGLTFNLLDNTHMSVNACELQGAAEPTRALFRRPKALQYFHNGELKKENEGERQAGRFELFLDLLYVALVANFAEDLAQHANGANLVKYILIFTPAWHIWSDLRELMNSYYNDDLAQRVLILWMMALMVLYGNNATLVAEDIGAMRTSVGAFMTARFTVVVTYLTYSFASFQHRVQARIMAGMIFFGLLLWIPLYFESVSIRAKIAVATVAVVYQEVSWVFTFGPWIKRKLKLEYSTAVDIDHEIDRLAAFFIVILGEFLYSIIVGNPAAIGLNMGLMKAIWTLVIAFCLNWLYVNGDGSIEVLHPIRRATFSAFSWFSLHLPLSAALLVGGHVAATSSAHAELERGERWLMCGGLGIGLACLWYFSMLFESKDPPGKLIFPKFVRMLPRLLVAVIILLLPLAHRNPPSEESSSSSPELTRFRRAEISESPLESSKALQEASLEKLDPVALLSIIMALFAFLVIWETIGGLERGARFWEKWDGTEPPARSGEPGLDGVVSGVGGEKHNQ